MSHGKKIARLNDRLAKELPNSGAGTPRFQWAKASDLYYFIRTGSKEVQFDGMRVVLTVPVFERRCIADRIDPRTGKPYGNRWMLAEWRLPCEDPEMTQRSWEISFPDMPYPAKGRWVAHTEVCFQQGDYPDEDSTELVIVSVNGTLAKTMWQHLVEIRETDAAKREAADKQWDDAAEEAWPAFRNPWYGKRGNHVSFGGIDSKVERSNESL